MALKYQEIPTPALLVNRGIMMGNLIRVQRLAEENGVSLRPHTKTHKTPELAQLQCKLGACGIAVAKTAEAEIMAEAGIQDIFLANEPVGLDKLIRLRALSERIRMSFGVDCVEHVRAAEHAFKGANNPARVLVEIEVGEERSGVILEEDFRTLVRYIKSCKNVVLLGVFSHDGNSYKAKTMDEARAIGVAAQQKTLRMAEIMREEQIEPKIVSIGSTTSILLGCEILKGITEIRIGTYIFMDASQSKAIGDDEFDTCAASVLLSVISKPNAYRVVLDGGAKSLTMQKRSVGLTANAGLGEVKGMNVVIARMNDEHAVIEDPEASKRVNIGEKLEVIPNHICPVVNLFKKMYLVENGEIMAEYPISCALATE